MHDSPALIDSAAAVLALAPRERLFTAEEYHALARAGVLTEDDRVELINGRIVTMSPIGPPHLHAVNRITELFARRLYARDEPQARLSVQNSIHLGHRNEPEPDLALLRPDAPQDRVPTPEDVLLVIEVADSSAEVDRRVKRPLYAAFGIAEVWIVYLTDGYVEVCREPGDEDYVDIVRMTPGHTLTVAALPDLPGIPVADILGR
ncbi:MAG: Uma2 family endonuclease [Rhodothermales bacterium]